MTEQRIFSRRRRATFAALWIDRRGRAVKISRFTLHTLDGVRRAVREWWASPMFRHDLPATSCEIYATPDGSTWEGAPLAVVPLPR